MVAEFATSTFRDKLPPHNIEAEEAIIGGILIDPTAIEIVVDRLVPEAFYSEAHKIIYRAAVNLYQQGKPTDLMSVTTWLSDHNTLEKIGGTNKLVQLVDRTVSAVNIDQYAALIVEKYLRRLLEKASFRISDLAYRSYWQIPEILEEAEFELKSVTELRNAKNLGNYLQSESEVELRKLTREIENLETIDNPFQKKLALKGLMKKWEMKSEKEFLDFHAKWLETHSKCRSLSLDEYLDLHGSKATEWLLEGWIPRTGITVLHSMGGLGKTTFLSYLSKCLITGENWCGYKVGRPLKILWVQCDQGAKVTIRMFDRQGFFALDPTVKVRQRIIDKWGIEEYQVLRKELQEHKYDLVIIDSLTTVSANLMYRENDQEYARPFARLRHLSEEFDAAFIILHHSDWAGKLRGSTAIFNAADQVWSLKKSSTSSSESRQLDMSIEKSRFMETPCIYRLQFNDDHYGWDLLGEVTQGAEGEEVEDLTARHSFQKLFSFLRDRRGTGFEAVELSELLGMGLATIRKELGFGTKKGLIESFRGNRPRSVYFVGELNTSSHNPVSLRTKDLNDPETGSSPNPYPASVDPFDPNDPENFEFEVSSDDLKNPGSNGSNGSIHTQSAFQNDPSSGSIRSLVRCNTGSGLSTVTEVHDSIEQESNCKTLDKQETPKHFTSEPFDNSISTALSVNVTDSCSVETLTDDDVQEFAEMIRSAIADPTLTESVQQTLSTFFAERPQEKDKVWKKLERSERESFKALTTKPLDGLGQEIKTGDRVQNLADEKLGTGMGSVITLEPKYRGSPKNRFVQWKVVVKWDFGFTSEEITTTTNAEMVQVLDTFAHLKNVESPEQEDESAPIDIKAITLHQPWASLIGKHKHYETRSWKTDYRGKIAIHAAKLSPSCTTELLELAGEDLPLGAVIAIADLTDCIEMTPEFISIQTETELRCGDWKPGRYAWKLENIRILQEPIPAKGAQGLWNWRPTAENNSVPEKWSPKVGDRCQSGGYPLTIKEAKEHYLVVVYDTGLEATLGTIDVAPLPLEKDPKIIAQNLFETLSNGDELRALKHPSHKGFARKRGKVLTKFRSNGKWLAKCETNSGTEVFNLEAVEVL